MVRSGVVSAAAATVNQSIARTAAVSSFDMSSPPSSLLANCLDNCRGKKFQLLLGQDAELEPSHRFVRAGRRLEHRPRLSLGSPTTAPSLLLLKLVFRFIRLFQRSQEFGLAGSRYFNGQQQFRA